ncbi:MAG: hypothetical protein JWQ54_2601 [Mucilaginibacter sp.]|nr:hypothetical protein [Mucilaginibacter sp.]
MILPLSIRYHFVLYYSKFSINCELIGFTQVKYLIRKIMEHMPTVQKYTEPLAGIWQQGQIQTSHLKKYIKRQFTWKVQGH